MTQTLVLIPVLNRPHRALPVAQSIRDTSDADIVFVVSDGDKAELFAVRNVQRQLNVGMLIVDPWTQGGDYARKINRAVRTYSAEWYFQGADDLTFHPGWLDAALAAATRTGALVVGTNDMANPRVIRGRHATHNLVSREWIDTVGTSDRQGVMLCEEYHHNFVDDELVQTAQYHRRWTFAADSRVEHHHPNHSDTPMDSTYEVGLDRHRFTEDRRLGRRRQAVWRSNRRRPSVSTPGPVRPPGPSV